MGDVTGIIARALGAYGGSGRWLDASHVGAVVDVSGLALRLERRPAFE